jgi:Uma2 family endonuclease
MSVANKLNRAFSAVDYLDGESNSDVRHEYINGEIYAMGGASDKHGLITANLTAVLNTRLPDECQVFTADMKVHIKCETDELFYYPDVLVSCDQNDRKPYYRESPCLIIEVLSPTTERRDRFEKFHFYTQLESLVDYVLISQEYRKVEVYSRPNLWRAEEYTEDQVRLDSVELTLSFDAIYRRVLYR